MVGLVCHRTIQNEASQLSRVFHRASSVCPGTDPWSNQVWLKVAELFSLHAHGIALLSSEKGSGNARYLKFYRLCFCAIIKAFVFNEKVILALNLSRNCLK